MSGHGTTAEVTFTYTRSKNQSIQQYRIQIFGQYSLPITLQVRDSTSISYKSDLNVVNKAFQLFSQSLMIAGMLWIVIRSQPCLREFSSKCRLRSFYRYMRSNSHAFLKVEVHGNGNVTGIAFTGKRSEPLYTGENDSENISLLLLL